MVGNNFFNNFENEPYIGDWYINFEVINRKVQFL